MARYTDPVCKRCRREQRKLYLKGSRCYSPKCPIDREMPPPGMHGHRKGKLSEYGIRLREKAKAQILLRHFGTAVPPLFRIGRPFPGKHGRAAANYFGAAPRQCDSPLGIRSVASRGTAIGGARPCCTQWPQVRYSQLAGQAERRYSGQGKSE